MDEQGRVSSAVARCEKSMAYLRQQKLDRLLQGSNLGQRFRDRRFETFSVNDENRKGYELCRRFVAEYRSDAKGIMLCGGFGTGKTHLAAAVVAELAQQGIAGVFVVVPDLLRSIRAGYSSKVEDDGLFMLVRGAPLLVLDDLGAERVVRSGQEGTSWVQEQLFILINYRYERMLPTIITSNYRIDELTQMLGARITSRLWEMTTGVLLGGVDVRKCRY